MLESGMHCFNKAIDKNVVAKFIDYIQFIYDKAKNITKDDQFYAGSQYRTIYMAGNSLVFEEEQHPSLVINLRFEHDNPEKIKSIAMYRAYQAIEQILEDYEYDLSKGSITIESVRDLKKIIHAYCAEKTTYKQYTLEEILTCTGYEEDYLLTVNKNGDATKTRVERHCTLKEIDNIAGTINSVICGLVDDNWPKEFEDDMSDFSKLMEEIPWKRHPYKD